jgi:putative PIN family toxin of toxin-antitoxin system
VSGLHRIVFDTSTLVSAALRVGSTPHRALALALLTGDVCVSASTLLELEQVLLRSKFDRYQTALVRKHAVLVAVSATDEFNVVPQCRDPKDKQFLALVLASEADVLVSSDADLLVLHPWRGVPIVTPGDFLDMS